MYLNNGKGTFAAGQVVNQNYTNYMLGTLLFDANGDGITDVMIADTYGALWVFFGKGDGTFDLTNYNLFGIGDVAYGLAAADVNGDGNMDVIGSGVFVNDLPAYGTEAGDQICVLLGDGKGNFSAPTVYRGDSSSYSLVVADFNGSGFPDAVTANQDNDSVSVFLNDGTGAFGAPDGNWVAYEGGGAVNAPMLLPGVVMADVDGNGTTDVTFMEWPPPGGTDNYYQLTVLLNDGSGNLSAPIRSDAATTLIGNYVLADFRNTGQPDFLGISQVYNSNGNYIAFVPNSGGGHFGPVKQVSSPNATGAIGVGDFNNDGNLDFVAAGPGINSDPNNLQGIQVYLGRGDGTFRTGYVQTFGGTSASRYPVAVYVGDFNRDGNLDLLVLLEGNSGYITNADLYEFLGNGDGTFQTGKVILPNIGPMTVADVDGDGYPDIVSMVSPIPSEIGIPTLSQFSIYIGQADGTFTLTNTYAPYNGSVIFPQEVTTTFTPLVADFNGDGIPDIAAFQQNGITYPDTYVQFLLGNGDGTFTPTYEVFDFRKPTLTVYAADLTGSGKAELFEFNGYRSTYNVLPSIVAPAFQFALLQDPLPGSQGNGIVVLDVPSASATTISLTASDPAITVPTTVTIPAGNISQTFSFTIGPAFNTSHVFAIYAQLGSTSATAYGTLLASAGFQAGAGGVTTWPNVDLGPGQTQELSAGVSSVNGYATTVSVQCLGLSPNAQCTVSPSTLILRSWDSATAGMTVTVAANTPQGSYPAKVQFTDGLFTQDVPFTLNVGDFSLSLSPQVLQVLATDQTGSYNLTVGSINSFDQVVTLGCGGSATGITCSTVPFTYPPTGSTPITVGVQTQTVPAGNYQITVTGTSTPITHTATAVLQVSDFTASVSPTSASVPQGGSTSFNITVSAVNGFAGTVSLACSSSAAVTCSFNPASVAVPAGGSGTSALTVTVPQSAADGNYPITISATSSQVTHTATVQMQVTADFTASLSPTSATVSAGGSANFNVGVTSESGFSGNVSLACSTSSPVTCSFKPNSLAVPANGSATSVLTVTASSQAAAATKLRTDRTPILALGVVLPIGAFFIVAKSRRRWVGFVVLVLALCGIPSCGSGSSGSGGGGGSQTYSITVQVSSGSSYTATAGTITLTVN